MIYWLKLLAASGLLTASGLILAFLKKTGPMHSLLYSWLGLDKPKLSITGFLIETIYTLLDQILLLGFVRPGFESVQVKFENLLKSGMEDKAQVKAHYYFLQLMNSIL